MILRGFSYYQIHATNILTNILTNNMTTLWSLGIG